MELTLSTGGNQSNKKICISMCYDKTKEMWEAWVAQLVKCLTTGFTSGHDPGVLGLSPTSGSLHGACFSLCLCVSHE